MKKRFLSVIVLSAAGTRGEETPPGHHRSGD